jgi:outer membrane murein-binding lipoprotein Lpp
MVPSMNDSERRIIERLGCDPEELQIDLDVEIDWDFDGDKLILRLLGALHRKVDKLMTDISALQAAVDNLVAAEGAAAEELVALKDEIATLQAGTISQEQIDSITGKVTSVADALTTATQEAGESPAPPAAGETAGEAAPAPGEPTPEEPPAPAEG